MGLLHKSWLLQLLAVSAFASDLVIHLPADSSLPDAPAVYVEDVVDSRADTSDIGSAMTGFFNTRSRVRFAHGLRQELLDYFGRVVPKREGARPLVVDVKDFQVGERMAFPIETARADIELEFRSRTSKGTTTIFAAKTFVERSSGIDVTDFHPSNLAQCLNQSLRLLSERKSDSSFSAAVDSSRSVPEKRKTAPVAQPMIEPGSHLTAILVNASIGSGATGGNVQILSYSEEPQGWTRPWLMDIEAISPRERDGRTGSFGMFVPSVAAFRRLDKGPFCILLQGGVPLGLETSQNASGAQSTSFFLGASFGESLALLPMAKAGLAAQAGLYQTALIGSKLYPYDVGIRLGLGYQF